MSRNRLSAGQLELLGRFLDERGISTTAGAVSRTADRSDIPLSFAQQRIWFFHRLQPTATIYNIAGTALLRGRLDVDALRRSLDEIVRRHEILRTTYPLVDGRPIQHISDDATIELPAVDLSGLPRNERDAAVRDWQHRIVNQPFDLERDHPLRFVLLRTAPEEHHFLLAQHHIATDGWSLGVILRELAALYTAYMEGRPSPLPELAAQYADFTLWQREWLTGEVERRQLDYWRERLDGAPMVDLPTDRLRPAGRTWSGDAVDLALPAALVRRLSTLADLERATQYMILLAAFAVVLSRWADQDDVVIGSPIANRNRLDTEAMIGCFVNTLPLRLDTSSDPTFRSLLAQAREVCLSAYAHQDVPFERIVEAVNPERDVGGQTPLIRHMLGLHNAPRPVLDLPDLVIEFDGLNTGRARFDLELEISPVPDGGLGGRAWFATDVFEADTVKRLLRGLRTVLTAAVADPGLPVGRIPLLAEPERIQLLDWSSGADESAHSTDAEHAYCDWLRHTLGLRSGETVVSLWPATGAAAAAERSAVSWAGGRMVVADPARLSDPAYLVRLLADERPSVLSCTPSQLAGLLADPGFLRGDVRPRHLLVGGEPLWPALLDDCSRVLPDAERWHVYRPDGFLLVAAHRLRGDARTERATVPVGKPIAGAALYVLDSHAELVPVGVTGELFVGGPAAALAPAGDRPCRTGDRARWSRDGTLEVLGPEGEVISVRGHRVDTGDVRAVLLAHPAVDRAEVEPVSDGLVAYASLRHENGSNGSPSAGRTGFEARYIGRLAEDDPLLNPGGWTSPSTGARLDAEQLRDWSETAVRRVLELRPRNVLEIGCRNGGMLFRLAPRCVSYCATDPSGRALARIREHGDWLGGRSEAIRLLRRAPDDFTAMEPDGFDVVLLSSIVQYAPSLEYVESVIAGAIDVARPGGVVMVSDVRSLPLLPASHVSAAQLGSLAEPHWTVSGLVEREDELLVDPAWFDGLATRLAGVDHATVLVRLGRRHSELTDYRYDVLLRVGGDGPLRPDWLDWPAGGLEAGTLDDLLRGAGDEPLAIRSVPDARTRVAVRAVELMAGGGPMDLAGLLQEAGTTVGPALDPTELMAAAIRHGRQVIAGPSVSGTAGLLDVVFHGESGSERSKALPRLGPSAPGPMGNANDIEHVARVKAAVPKLRGHLRERLPDYMVPADLLVPKVWPIGPDGVLDATALPRPVVEREQEAEHRSPRTDVERAVAKIWADVLGIDRVGADDDFFALGGHSLMGAEVVELVREQYSLDLPLGRLFEAPTVAAVAEYIETAQHDPEPAVASIRRIDRSSYRRKSAPPTRGSDSDARGTRQR